MILEEYEYDVEVPYNYYICTVTLENFNLSHVPVYIMGEDQLSMYAMYMATLGNRPDLFAGSEYVSKYYDTEYEKYEIPPEALEDEQFAAMIAEAEKYLGYPYVWGGSSPSTSFDCSGFVSWVINNCGVGWNVGRLGASGLLGICTRVSPANAKPGDLIFFQGTYDTDGASHVGIYVGNGKMLHCGDPIQYTSIETSYNKWQNQFGRHVMRGEKGITIIAPTPYKKKIEEEKLDPNTQKPMLDENGDVIMEEKEIRIPMFRPTTVFDVAQTEGKPLPERVANPVATLTGDVEHYEVFMEALRRSSPVPIRAGEMDADTDGYFSRTDQEIVYREGMSQIQTVSAVIHEIGHAKLHNYGVQQAQAAAEAGTELPKPKDRNTEEVEAESISCAVCAFFGIDTGANSFGYIAYWSKDKKLPEFRASLDIISRAADSIITDVETHFAEICKERGIDLSEKTETHTLQEQEESPSENDEQPVTPVVERIVEEAAPETAPEMASPPDPTMSIAAMNAFGYTDGDMLPLSKERALELMERDVTVYMLYENNAEAMAFEPEDIEMHTGIFGITREDWDAVRDTIPAMDTSLVQQKQERAFLESPMDSFAIYQLKCGEERADYRFENSDYLRRHGITPERTDYDLVYTGELPLGESTMEKLEGLYRTFNTDHPEDFRGHSLSVSDIVAIRQDGVVSCHYVDSVG